MKLGPVGLAIVMILGCSRGPVGSSPVPPPGPVAGPPSIIAMQATASIIDLAGNPIGTAGFADTRDGLLIRGAVSGLGKGTHGVHLHAVGSCAPPFSSAGPHFNPTGAQHGYKNPSGHHAGDLPNIVTPPAGTYPFQFVVDGVKLTGKGGLLDADGASIVFHSSADDFLTDPSGNSGARLACGVITLAK